MKSKHIHIKIEPEWHEHYMHQAKAEGFPSLSAYVIWLLSRERKRIQRKR